MIDYRKLNVGDRLIWSVTEPFDAYALKRKVIVTDVDAERAIAVWETDSSVHLWIDDDTAEDFSA